jgi:hypothetical protein
MPTTPTPREDEAAFLNRVLLEDRDAVVFALVLAQISQVLDDLVDNDAMLSGDTITRAFWQALVALPCNGFYQRHFDILQPQIQMVFFDWLNANVLEQGSDEDRNLAFVLRDSLTGLLVTCARLVGGYEHAQGVGPEIRRRFHDESLEAYKEGLT